MTDQGSRRFKLIIIFSLLSVWSEARGPSDPIPATFTFFPSTIVRSAGWIQTGYKNMNSPSTFLSIGPETQTPVASSNRGLTIQGGKVTITGGQVKVQ